ncbi:dipeptidylpeptidase [Coemansia sp. RSA 2559]|nr:dipeptidylpeptidase [Coemansia sp. RSA 2559]KAJ2869025.1 dipeptidylpeptidase [Coemansia erecta]
MGNLFFFETGFEGKPFDSEARKNYERWLPERFVQNWKTPTLAIHSEKHYRFAVSEGISTFTALRRQDIPAKLRYYPSEGHLVLKPANSLYMRREIMAWLSKWTQDGDDCKVWS